MCILSRVYRKNRSKDIEHKIIIHMPDATNKKAYAI